MTTIAVRNGMMACDSMEVVESEAGGSRAFYYCRKIYKIDGELIGMSGDSDGGLLWFDWYMDGCRDKDFRTQMQEYDFDVLILHKGGRIETSGTSGAITEQHDPFYAIGSGSKCALAAMHMGAAADRAVGIASLVDTYTGGETQVFTI